MSWKKTLALTIVFATLLLTNIPVSKKQPVVVSGLRQSTPELSKLLDSTTSYPTLTIKPSKINIYAKSYLLLDAQTNEILAGQNYRDAVPIASTTKMTTALIAAKYLDLDKVVTIGINPPRINGSKIGLLRGEKITIRNLLAGLLISSGNDAAIALAEAYSQTDSIAPFVVKMNVYAQEHGLISSRYLDPAGLNDDGRSSTFELSQVAELLLANPTLAEMVKISETTISSTNGTITHQLKNSNRLVLPDSPYYLNNVIGLKTGFTLEAGHCLVAAAIINGRLLIGVVLNTNISSITASAVEMNKLFRIAEQNLQIETY